MDWHLQAEVLIAKSRTLIDESRNLLRASRGLKTEAKSRVSNQKLRSMKNRSHSPVRNHRSDRDTEKLAA